MIWWLAIVMNVLAVVGIIRYRPGGEQARRARWKADHPRLRWKDWRHITRR